MLVEFILFTVSTQGRIFDAHAYGKIPKSYINDANVGKSIAKTKTGNIIKLTVKKCKGGKLMVKKAREDLRRTTVSVLIFFLLISCIPAQVFGAAMEKGDEVTISEGKE